MKIEQILFNRIGAADFKSGWTTKQTSGVGKEALDNFRAHCNAMVAGLSVPLADMPERLYLVWHGSKYIFCVSGQYVSGERGNMMGHGYLYSQSDYFPTFSEPGAVTGIQDFVDTMDVELSQLESVTKVDLYDFENIISKFNLSDEKLVNLIHLILTAVLKRQEHKKSLKIVIDKNTDEFYNVAREIMYCVYKLLPEYLGLNISFSSFAHDRLTGIDVMFTNKQPEDYYINLDTGEYKWSKAVYEEKGHAKAIVRNRCSEKYKKHVNEFMEAAVPNYTAASETVTMAWIYSSIIIGSDPEISLESAKKIYGRLLTMPTKQIYDKTNAYMLKWCSKNGHDIPMQYEMMLLKKYSLTTVEELKKQIEYYEAVYYCNDITDEKINKLRKVYATCRDVFDRINQYAYQAGNKEYLLRAVKEFLYKNMNSYNNFKKAAPVSCNILVRALADSIVDGDQSGQQKLYEIRRNSKILYIDLDKTLVQENHDWIVIEIFILKSADLLRILVLNVK